ncbi:unnamed protein product, partial [Vitis vinifera]|uniref:Uncharacterized protein n=1 Tax=Vitis vinifera TaxID=29760 RepID=D7SX12_VITVI
MSLQSNRLCNYKHLLQKYQIHTCNIELFSCLVRGML